MEDKNVMTGPEVVSTQPDTEVVVPDGAKVYTVNVIAATTYFGGPIAGIYMMSKNFEAWGDDESAQKYMRNGMLAVLAVVLVFVIAPLSWTDAIPNSLLPITYTATIYSLTKKYQKDILDNYLKNGGIKHSGWKAFGIGIVSIIALVAMFFFLLLVLPDSIIF